MPKFETWLRVSRFNFLPVSLFPYACGGLFALRAGGFRVPLFIIGLFGTALVHLAANLFNEYWDFRLEADATGRGFQPHYGGSQSIQSGLVSPGAVHLAGWICLGAAFGLALTLAIHLRAAFLIVLVAAGGFLAWAYTARPLSLAYRGWGEAALLAAFGPLLVLGGFYLQVQKLTGAAALLSLLPGFLTAAVLIANEMADAESDRQAGKMNLAARWGADAALGSVQFCFAMVYLLPGLGVALAIFPPGFLLVAATLPLALIALRSLRAAINRPPAYSRSSTRILGLHISYHILLIIAIIAT